MKNLKKALSLVLASAMLIGMMVVGTGAAHSDVKAEHNEEAIAVVTAAGIMGAGDTFNPDGELTRGEMAVIMTNMLDLDTKDFKGSANFTDAGWAADYIDACYANGIMAGVSATEFGTNMKVTTAQAALMMLKALGYFEEAPLNDWMLDTIKQASKIDLLDGIDAKASAVLTRNEVAQLALNALEATCVEETANGANTSIKGEGFEISVDSTVSCKDLTTTKYDYDGSEENTLQLIEKLYEDRFTKDAGEHDDLDMPGTKWFDADIDDDDNCIAFAAKKASKVLVSDGEFTSALALYNDKVNKKTELAEDAEDKDIIEGSEVYYFLKDGEITEIVVLDYVVAQIDEIEDEVKKVDKSEGISAYIDMTFKTGDDADTTVTDINDTDFAGFDYEEDDYVMVIMGEGKTVLASYAAEIVEGKITAVKGAKVKVDGTYYKDLTETLNNKDEIEVIVNKAGQIVYVIDKNAAVLSDNIAYIYNVVENDADKNEDGRGEGTYTAYVVLADGSKAKYVIASKTVEVYAIDEDYTAIVPYVINKDGKLEIKDTDKVATDVADVELNKDNKFVATVEIDEEEADLYADSKTEFIFADWNDDGDKMVVTTETGIKNVNINGDEDEDAIEFTFVYDKENEKVLYVFVIAKQAGLDVDAEYVVITDATAVETVDEDDDEKKYYTYATNKGEITFETEQSFDKGDVIAYVIEDGYAVIADEVEAVKSTIKAIGEDFFTVADEDAEYTYEDAAKYTVTFEWNEDDSTELDELIVKSGASLKKGAEITLFANDKDEVKALFIIKNNY